MSFSDPSCLKRKWSNISMYQKCKQPNQDCQMLSRKFTVIYLFIKFIVVLLVSTIM